jgi:hypothetical protein
MAVVDIGFKSPLFFCPIAPAVNPAIDSVERRAIQWIDDIGLVTNERDRARVLGTNSAEFYGRFAPDASEDELLVAVLWVYWGFAFDDARCDSGPMSDDPSAFLAMAGRLQRAMEDSEPPTDRFSIALHDIVQRMRTCASPTQVRRFIDAHRHWLYCVAWQIGNKAEGRMPGLDEYLAMRIGAAGGPPTIALLEIANKLEIPAREMDSPPVRALTEMTQLIAALDNDLQSYRKEAEETHTGQNIVNVLVHHENRAAQDAVTRAIAIRDRMMIRLLDLRDRVWPGASPELDVYLRGLGHAIRGNIDWAARVPRYQGDQRAEPVTTGRPHDDTAARLPVTGFSWWWDQLA